MLIFFFILFCNVDRFSCDDYYVVPSNDDKRSCPSGAVECHAISHYINISRYIQFPLNVSFLFLEGEYEFSDNFYLLWLNEVVLRGLGKETRDHISTTSIKCTSVNSTSFYISNVTTVYIEGLSIINCDFGIFIGRLVTNVYINRLSIQNSRFFGVKIKKCITLKLHNVKMFNNGLYNMGISENIVMNVSSSHFIGSSSMCLHCSYTVFDSCIFDNSTLVVELYASSQLDSSFHMSNSVVHRFTFSNLPISGCVELVCHHANVYFDNVTIANNNATGMAFIQCGVIFKGQPSVIADNHSLKVGGGIYLDIDSTITSENNTIVSFINNTADNLGGAMYITSIKTCSAWNLHPLFYNNLSKKGGNNIYGGLYVYCTLPIPEHIRHFVNRVSSISDVINCDNYTTLKYFPKPISTYISTEPLFVCLCTKFNTTDCSKRTISREVYPGQSIITSLVMVGQCGGISPGGLEVTGTNGVEVITYSNQRTGMSCKNFTYSIKQGIVNAVRSQGGQLSFSYDNIYKGSSASFIPLSPFIINIRFLLCPFGLAINLDDVCDCNEFLTNIDGINCTMLNISYPISRSGNKWLYYSHQDNCTVAYTNCPFDYCDMSTVHLNLNQSDVQCTHNRSGTLCGQCQEGQSVMLGSNQCGFCENKYLSVIIVFIAAGFSLIFFLFINNLTISTGNINGLLFYANIISLNQAVLFNGTSIPVLTQFISWINLDLGIEVCFFNGLNDYWKTWLQFVFPLYIWLLTIGIILGSRYSIKISRYCGNNSVPVLATLIVMSFTKLSRNITKALMISSINCNGIQWRNVWSADGNVEYLNEKHIPLFVVSIVLLLIGLIYTVVIFCSQWLQKYGGRYCRSSLDPYVRLKPFVDAHTGPFNDKYRFWTGLLLTIRFVLTGIFAYTTGVVYLKSTII